MTSSPPLAALLPAPGEGPLSPDDILDRFVSYASALGLSLYPAQEEAILELLAGKHVILGTPTGSGKSLVATALHFLSMAEGKRSFYTCPIKALVNEKFFALCRAFGPENVGMLTGDASINREAPIVCCTAEILANLAIREDDPAVHHVVMDEFHYYADRERGMAWQLPLLALPKTTFLLMSATLGDTTAIARSLEELTGRKVAEVHRGERPVPLDYEYRETPLHETVADLLREGRYPIYLVHFTQRAAAEQAQNLMSVDFCSKEEKQALRLALQGTKFDTPYGKELSRFLHHGIGLHHAGLLPKYRLLVEKLSQQGLLKVVCGTDTLGVGVNIPIRTVLFTQLCKFDGQKTAVLRVRDFHQVAGRAGRKGFDTKGSVVAQAPEHVIENLRAEAKALATGKKKPPKKAPPQKGYAHWDRGTFEKLITSRPEPLESRFEVTHGLLLNLLQNRIDRPGGGYRRLLEIIARSHGNDYTRRQHKRAARARFHELREAGIVTLVEWYGRPGRAVEVSADLQEDFSIHHTLALYLLHAVELLDKESESYALDLLTLVESILENPDVILYKQLDKARGEKVAELKAQGMEYDDRMRELEKVEYPKPNADFIYATFNEFARTHPWVGAENIRPKSVARELYERYCSFDDYIREYGLQRSEGILLRYLSECYKTLVQTVPEAARTEEVADIIAHLRALLTGIDSSLLDEWERMRGLAPDLPAEGEAAPPPGPADLAADSKALTRRVRAELHGLLKALADRNYGAAVALVAPSDPPWTPERFEAELAPYWEEHDRIDLTPAARRPHNTVVKQVAPRRWEVMQRIVDPTGEADWAIAGVVDLSGEREEGAPLVELVRIGI